MKRAPSHYIGIADTRMGAGGRGLRDGAEVDLGAGHDYFVALSGEPSSKADQLH